MLLLSKILLVIAAPFMGSFLGAVIARWSSGRPLYSGRATCDCGQVVLEPRDMIPIVSWVVSRGRCRVCVRGLGRLYPGIEISALVIAIWAVLALPGAFVWTGAAFGWVLLVVGMIAWREGRLPLPLLVALGIAGLLVASSNGLVTLRDHVFGAIVGIIAYLVAAQFLNQWRKQQLLRSADGLLPAALGAWLGWQGLADLLLLSAVAASALFLFRRTFIDRAILAGLCAGGWVAWLYPLWLVR
jgi:leader peptidase (prepilin peptidase)/N-methyltransferase